MLRFLIIPIVIMVGYLLLWGVWQIFLSSSKPSRRGRRDLGELKGSDMVLDPNCQTYLPKERALRESIGGEVAYFCSKACLESYRAKREGLREGP